MWQSQSALLYLLNHWDRLFCDSFQTKKVFLMVINYRSNDAMLLNKLMHQPSLRWNSGLVSGFACKKTWNWYQIQFSRPLYLAAPLTAWAATFHGQGAASPRHSPYCLTLLDNWQTGEDFFRTTTFEAKYYFLVDPQSTLTLGISTKFDNDNDDGKSYLVKR